MNTFYGLLGQSLSHSMSPVIHQTILDILGIPGSYHLFEVEKEQLPDALSGLKVLGAVGVNVTIPHKTEVMQYLDAISPEAAAIGSVNSISFKDDKTTGYNTDFFGFGMLLERHGVKVDGMEALVLGYGGAAKAVIRFLLDSGVKNITIALRNNQGNSIDVTTDEAYKISTVGYDQLMDQKAGDIIINCTPCGMYPHIDESPVSDNVLSKYHTAVDIIYNPIETLFLRKSRKAGLRAVNGLYMLVSQAVAAQEIWNGVRLSKEEVEKIYNTVFEYMMKKTGV